MININKAFSYPFKDKDWPIKILVGAAISALPIANFISVGYKYKIFKSTLNGREPYMPEWDDFKALFIQGLWLFLIGLCYIVPPMIVGYFGLMTIFVGVLVVVVEVSVGVIIILTGVCFFAASFFLWILVSFIYPMALANYAKNDEDFASAFRIFEIFKKVISVFGGYLLAFVAMYAAVFIMLILFLFPVLGIFFSILGIFFAFYISYLLWPGLFGPACIEAFEADERPKTALEKKKPTKKNAVKKEPAKKEVKKE